MMVEDGRKLETDTDSARNRHGIYTLYPEPCHNPRLYQELTPFVLWQVLNLSAIGATIL